ncbi:hypothetical protein BO70DRAFT_166034 [Aspergillus heteromorphus CBS 117.55]|uniref:BTB domain-containing protein n=1 Tax=Aspergillus heteromorphus CBS 117.55 TaxID=1448321 RepID=A0A317WX10_9EURO|nr:uncharacterized protein BO70DRAFT_166034 [Aspergillus heteromorphus CBS 117.55]PWY89338.1 hypothetical protein BO70DRAFT_166034 [Aspergillus heteromorphus CBS 117.55]
MEPDRDYSSIVHSPPFTFLVGPNHTKLTIQSGLARHVSQPLDHLMNSGETRESKHHIAVLEEEDVETFVAFCEYAYTGDYRVPPPGSREEDREEPAVQNPFRGVFSNDPSSPAAVPPRAPSPPRAPEPDDGWSRPDAENGSQGKEDDWECAIAPDDELQHPAPPVTEEPSEQPPPTPAAEQGDGDGWDAGDDEPKGKKGKKGKKDKKKKKSGAAAEEPSTSLTPPSTPPLENSKPVEDAANPPAETSAAQESQDWSEPVNAPEQADAAPSSLGEGWEQAAPTPPDVEAVDTARGDEKDMTQRVVEDDQDPRYEAPTKRQTGPMIDTSFAKQQYSRMNEKGSSLWDDFAAIDYVDPRSCFGTRPPSVMSSRSRSSFELPYLVFHAKIYVFATRYLIPALAQLCLRKLHRDLLYLGFAESSPEEEDEDQHILNSTKARKVLDLLHYTYNKTTRLEPITPTSATQLRDNELRKLVVHFAACKVRDLAAYCPPVDSDLGSASGKPRKLSAQGFRALLDTTTELASDLVYRMMM